LYLHSLELLRISTACAALRDLLLPKLISGQIDATQLDLDPLTRAALA
jgi:hypothetical protein